MSSESDTPADGDYMPWVDVTPAQKRVAKTIVYVHGPASFERPALRNDTEETDDLERVVDSKSRVLTSLKYTTLLNKLEEEGYLIKEFQGGKNPIVIDWEYEEERDSREVAPFGYNAALNDIVTQVLEREGLTRDTLGDVDLTDFNAVIDAVNTAVGRNVLAISSDPSEYRFTKEAYGLVQDKIEEELEEDEE